MAKRYDWNPHKKVNKFLECLKGDAFVYVTTLNITHSFDEMKYRLEKRFDVQDSATTLRKKLSELIQRDDKHDIAEYHAEVHFLTMKAYPNSDPTTIDDIATNQFLGGLVDREAAKHVYMRHPVDYFQALQFIRDYQAAQVNLTGARLISHPLGFAQSNSVTSQQPVAPVVSYPGFPTSSQSSVGLGFPTTAPGHPAGTPAVVAPSTGVSNVQQGFSASIPVATQVVSASMPYQAPPTYTVSASQSYDPRVQHTYHHNVPQSVPQGVPQDSVPGMPQNTFYADSFSTSGVGTHRLDYVGQGDIAVDNLAAPSTVYKATPSEVSKSLDYAHLEQENRNLKRDFKAFKDYVIRRITPERSGRSPSPRESRGNSRPRSPSPQSGCFQCGSLEHLVKDCPERQRLGGKSPTRGRCFECNSTLHQAKDCPSKQGRALSPKRDGCFECGSKDHRFRDCPRRQIPMSSSGDGPN